MGYSLGIDLGGAKILSSVLDDEANILSRSKKKTKAEGGAEDVIGRIVDVARKALDKSGIAIKKIDCIGVGAPGPLDPVGGVVHEAPNLGWKNVKLAGILREILGQPVFLSNDVDAGTWGEYLMGAGKGSRNCLGAFVGTGLGGGLVFDGKLYRGSGFMAGEIGHLLMDRDGPTCGCGRRGCLEVYTSRTYIARSIWKQVDKGRKSIITGLVDEPGGQIRSSMLKTAVDEGDKLVMEAVQDSAWMLGLGLGSVCNLINPDCIVLGGGVIEALGDFYMGQVEEGFKVHSFKTARKSVKIVTASLGDDAGVTGAALLARSAMEG
jgi:glucokinase